MKFVQKVLDVDADDLFAYKTPRRVVIRDRKLGMARILIMIALFVYVVIYEVILQKGYLIKDEPVGFATVSVRRGDSTEVATHCCPSLGCGGTCTGASQCPAQTTESTCTTTTGCTWNPITSLNAFGSDTGMLECVNWDRHNTIKPPTEEYSVLITSRVKVTEYQELPSQCRLNKSSNACAPWQVQRVTPYYTQGIEDMTIMIDHGVYGRESKTIVMGQDMHRGVFEDNNGNAWASFCGGTPPGMSQPDVDKPCTEADRSRPGDIFTVRQLLQATGITTLNTKISSNDTLRYDGIVILVIVSYDGTGIDTELQYAYRTFSLKGVEYMYEESFFETTRPGYVKRSVWKRHGIRMVIVPAGYVAIFSFAELMKTLMIATGLFSIAKFLVERLLIRFLPMSSVYKRYRDVKTVDFSDFSKESLAELKDVHFVYGEVREGGTVDPSGEREVGDKLDERVEEFKTQNPLPPPPQVTTFAKQPHTYAAHDYQPYTPAAYHQPVIKQQMNI
eukprot:TRINITY_DN569_c2_g1_i1.p1 TRINITY_DN569_c2_g1~~TRINITY_DN569_c2_g1_i1.p1  ORF type:complete len:504 (+),score=91.96 TRINITY_DN569_c2_g1_i1:63-1574(+)